MADPIFLPSFRTANTTPTGFDTSEVPVLPFFSSAPTTQQVPPLSGPTTISQGTLTPGERALTFLPAGTFRDVVRDVISTPRNLLFGNPEARQANAQAGLPSSFQDTGLLGFDSDIEKIDRIASALIRSGTNRLRAYEIASLDVQRNKVTNVRQSQNAFQNYLKLRVTPEEEKAMSSARNINALNQGLALSNFIPVGGTLTSRAAREIAEQATPRVGKQSLSELQDAGLLTKGTTRSMPTTRTSQVLPRQTQQQTNQVASEVLDQVPYGQANQRLGQARVPQAGDQITGQVDNQRPTVGGFGTGRGDVPSLPQILDSSNLDVKSKVTLLDYVRTPDRVLQKIGFGKEAKQVRNAYEGYIKELPKNIDKITEWSKRVPTESSQRIFQYLDGKPVQLAPEELEVANEIKFWLKEWADRLGLPEDNRIANYITHLFDEELLKKEFDEDLAKIIADKVPGSVYDPFLQKRLGKLGYREDAWAALDAYVKRATRKVHMDPALDAIQSKAGVQLEFSRLEESQFRYIKRYLDRLNMRPTEFDNLIDNTIKNSPIGYALGQRPVANLSRMIRRATYRGLLGLNPMSALRNLSQGANTYAVLGEKYTALGYLKFLSNPREGLRQLKEAGVLGENIIQDRVLSSTKKLWEKADQGLFAMFQGAEVINRGGAYFGGMAKALAEGKSMDEAIDYAKEVVRKTQFSFTPVDTPVALQSDLVKVLTQLQTYTVKQTEFLAEMVKDKNFVGMLRYALAGYVFVNTLGKLIGMEWKDIIPTFRFEVPPSLKLPWEIMSAGLGLEDEYGNERDTKEKLSDIGKAAVSYIPGGSALKRGIEGFTAVGQGGSFDKGDNLQYEIPNTRENQIRAALFGKSSLPEAQNYFNRKEIKEKEKDQVMPIYLEAQRLKAEGKQAEANALVDQLGDKGWEVYKQIRSEEKSKKTKELQKSVLPTYQKAQKLISEGKKEEANALVQKLTDEEYEAYQQLKKKLQK